MKMKKFLKVFLFLVGWLVVRFLDYLTDMDVGYQISIVPALIGAGALLASTAASVVSSKKNAQKSNAMSLQMQREQNAWNLEQWNRERAFTEQMWNKENEYNTPANQRKRLEEAGLNPYLMLNGANAGVASSASTPAGHPAASAFQPAVMDPNLIQSGIEQTGNMFSSLLRTRQQLAENRMAETQAQYQEQQIIKGLVKLDEETNSLRGDIRKKAQEVVNLGIDEQLKNAALRVENFNAEHLESRYNMEVNRFQSDMATAEIQCQLGLRESDRQDVRLANDIKHINALIYQAYASGDLAIANQAVAYAQEHLYGQEANTEGERTREQKAKADKAGDLIQANIDNLNRQNRGKVLTEGKNIGEYLKSKFKEAKKQEFKFVRSIARSLNKKR